MTNLIWLRIRQNIKIKKIIVIELVIIALFFMLARGFENYQDEYKKSQRIVVGLDNQDRTIPANMLVNNFKNTEHFADLFELRDLDAKNFKSEIKAGNIDAAVSMPKGFADALYHFENKPVTLITKTSTPTKNAILEGTLSGYSKYVKGVDMACYAYNNLVESKETDAKLIEAREKGITVDLLYATLNRDTYFEKRGLSQIKMVNSMEYYSLALPFSMIAFISLIASFKRIRERHLSIQKRIKISGISIFKQLIADYIAEILFTLLIFLPLIIYRLIRVDSITTLKFTLSVVIASIFFSNLWRFLSHLVKTRSNTMILGISISFINALISGAIVPYILLNKNIKGLGEYSLNFKLTRYTMEMTDLINLSTFFIIITLLFLINLRLEKRA